jgi:hypothetical protein
MASETKPIEKSIKEELKEINIKLASGDKKNKFIFPGPWRRNMNKARKESDSSKILLLFLDMNGDWKMEYVPIVSGNLVVIDNKVFRINPKDITRIKDRNREYRVYACREIDRLMVPVGNPSTTRDGEGDFEPISNTDHDEICKEPGRSTDNDKALIKAMLAAYQESEKLKKKFNPVMIIVGIVILIIVIVVISVIAKSKGA